MLPPLVVLGCGFAGTAAARLALGLGRRVVATTRDPARAAALARDGVDARCAALTPSLVAALVADGADALVAFPPDGATDDAVAPSLGRARAVVYVSSTAVYGATTGRVDARTPVAPDDARGAARLAAEDLWRATGAVALRAAGIYGPGRGIHLRLARGELRVAADAGSVVSRIHVEDLAALCLAALDRAPPGAVFVAADAAPVPQGEAIRWLAARLGVAHPPTADAVSAGEGRFRDRAVDASATLAALGVALRFPSYREGFEHALSADGLSPHA